jgi:membrane-associated phospholipid phosphatase
MASPLSGPARGLPLLPLAAALTLVGTAALFVDVPVARWFKTGTWPAALPRVLIEVADEIHRLVSLSEVVAHTASVAVILALVLALDPGLEWPARLGAALWKRDGTRRPLPAAQAAFARMLGATVTGAIGTDIVKLCVARVRPRAADFSLQASVWDSFSQMFVATVTGSRSNIQSFPSGHSAMAAGFAAALAWRYPRGRRFFALFALMAMAQRVVSSAHFPSDTCFGAALGLAGAALFLGPPGPTAPGAEGTLRMAARGSAGAHGGAGADSV